MDKINDIRKVISEKDKLEKKACKELEKSLYNRDQSYGVLANLLCKKAIECNKEGNTEEAEKLTYEVHHDICNHGTLYQISTKYKAREFIWKVLAETYKELGKAEEEAKAWVRYYDDYFYHEGSPKERYILANKISKLFGDIQWEAERKNFKEKAEDVCIKYHLDTLQLLEEENKGVNHEIEHRLDVGATYNNIIICVQRCFIEEEYKEIEFELPFWSFKQHKNEVYGNTGMGVPAGVRVVGSGYSTEYLYGLLCGDMYNKIIEHIKHTQTESKTGNLFEGNGLNALKGIVDKGIQNKIPKDKHLKKFLTNKEGKLVQLAKGEDGDIVRNDKVKVTIHNQYYKGSDEWIMGRNISPKDEVISEKKTQTITIRDGKTYHLSPNESKVTGNESKWVW